MSSLLQDLRHAGRALRRRPLPADVPRLEQAALDGRMLAFAIVLTAASALLAGLAPAAMASKPSLTEALADGARTAGARGGHPRLRALLLAAEGAVALVLLAGAVLLVRTFENLRSVELGYDAWPRSESTASWPSWSATGRARSG